MRIAEKIYDSRYDALGAVGDPCTYCGVVSDTMDHIPPLHAVASLSDAEIDAGRCIKVPACAECNSIICGRFITSIRERRELVREKLKKKYKKFIHTPNWDEDELDELEPEFAQYVRACMRFGEWIRRRLSWMRGGTRAAPAPRMELPLDSRGVKRK